MSTLSRKFSQILSPMLLGCILFVPALADEVVPNSQPNAPIRSTIDNPLPGDVPGTAEPVGSPKRTAVTTRKSRSEAKFRKRDVNKRQAGKRSSGKVTQRKGLFDKSVAGKHKSTGSKEKSKKPLKKRKK
ncbi:hypothetical protein [Chitinimonas sp. BJB300]|uniref:hypothetical protein n=1 Tax=Chitinimonas sp. BJB300 TaxID=1559339 RepID=UPI001111D682|nr:hypothetical protein [Chitinimonas sp. BJB300]TSJ89999.1 hypothetical protein FG002_007360 [Chitinimonas sp. BJB300]